MNPSLLGPALALLFLTFAPPSPQAAPAPSRDAQTVSILQQAVAAMGGAPPDSTLNGSVTATVGPASQTGTITVFTLGTNQSQEVINLPNLSQTITYSTWLASQANSSGTTQVSSQLAATSQTALFPSPLLAGIMSNSDYTLQYVGAENLASGTANHIRASNTFASYLPYLQPVATFTTRDIWLDQTSSLPVKMTFTQAAAAGSYTTLVEVDFSNYQQSGGFAYPSVLQKSVNGTPWLTISVQSAAFNTGLQANQFQINCNSN